MKLLPKGGDESGGKAKGGMARAAKLSPARRSAIATDAARQRWVNRSPVDMPQVLPEYIGVLNLSGTMLPCAVIDGPNGIQRVLTEAAVTNAILGSRSGASKRLKRAGAPLPLFLAPSQLNTFISDELRDGPLQPIDYVDGNRIVRGSAR